MVRLGFDDDEPFDEESIENEESPKLKEEDVEEIDTNIFISETRKEQFFQECDCVVVHEYGDDYHLSEEEKRKHHKFYEAFLKVRGVKHKYGKLDRYVKVCRDVLSCLYLVAEDNGIYSKEEFIKMFVKNKIYINGLWFPKYIGKDRKQVSWDYISDFILSDKDPKDVIPKRESDAVYSDEEMDEFEEELFDEGELDRILKAETIEERHEKDRIFLTYEKDVNEDGFTIDMDAKDLKEMRKAFPDLTYALRDRVMSDKQIRNMPKFVYSLTSEDFESIGKYENAHKFKSSNKFPEFKGNLMNDDDYHKYLMALDEWEEENTIVNYGGRNRTLGQVRDLEMKKFLEDHDWNIRNLYEYKMLEEKEKRKIKREKKRERALREKLVAVQERRKKLAGGETVDYSHKKKKKKKREKMKKKLKEID